MSGVSVDVAAVAVVTAGGVEAAPRERGQAPPLLVREHAEHVHAAQRPVALVQAALETDPAAKAQVLAVNAMTPLERALASFQHSILARDS